MKTLRKVLVITEGGKVVGTQIQTGQRGQQRGVTSALRAGPGQARHEVEVEVPARFGNAHEIQAFHDLVAGRLGLTK